VIVHPAAFAALSAVLIIAPGLDTALIMRNALVHGRRAAVSTALGTASGMLAWTLACAAGLAAVIEASATLFTLIKVIGAAYLIWIGVTTLLASRRGHRSAAVVATPRPAMRARTAYRQGLVCNIANPKAAVIFTSLLPQFVSGAHPSAASFLLLGGLFTAIALVLLESYALAAARAARLLARGRVRAVIDRLTAVLLIGLGVRLATEHR